MGNEYNSNVTVSSLYVYPVKGCKGQAVDRIDINETGFAMDRQWMIVSSPKMKNVYQLPLTRMALIRPHLPEICWTGNWRTLGPSDACLTISAPDMPLLKIPLAKDPGKKKVKCTLWEWQGLAQDEGEEAAAWLTTFLGEKLRLVRYAGDESDAASAKRRVKPKYTPPGSEILTTFSYGFQLLLTSRVRVLVQGSQRTYFILNTPFSKWQGRQKISGCTAKDTGYDQGSAYDLHSRMGEELPDDRWRPNIVVDGADPWSEDLWERFTVTNANRGTAIDMVSVRPCDRCKVTATNQETLEQKEEPLRTLKRFRQGKHLGLTSAAVYFGWYVLALEQGRISIGDRLSVTRSRSHFSDYGDKGPKVSKGSASFVGSPEWVASIAIIVLAAALYAYAMHSHFWGL